MHSVRWTTWNAKKQFFFSLHSIRTQLVAVVAFLAILLAVVSATFATHTEMEVAQETREDNAIRVVETLAMSLRNYVVFSDNKSLYQLICNVIKKQGGDYIIVDLRDSSGLVFQDFLNGTDPSVMPKDLLDQAHISQKLQIVHFKERIHVALPVDGPDGSAGVMMAGWALPTYWSVLKTKLFQMLCAVLPVVLFGYLIILFISRRFIEPLKTLTDAAERISKGDLDVEIKTNGQGEIGQLSVAFKSMAETVSQNIKTMEKQAREDFLTELPNRAAFEVHLDKALESLGHTTSSLAIVFIDVDHFKRINDTLGHAQGDLLLVRVTEILKDAIDQVTRKSDGSVLSRFGGDEFTLMLPNVGSRARVLQIAKAIYKALEEPVDLTGFKYPMSVSMGAAFFGEHGEDAATLMRCADLAMYHSKRNGRGQCSFFSEEMAGDLDTVPALKAV